MEAQIMKKKVCILFAAVMISCAVEQASCADASYSVTQGKASYVDKATQTTSYVKHYASSIYGKVKSFFGDIEKITIQSKSLSYALLCAFFDLKLSYADMIRIKNFKANNEKLLNKVAIIVEKEIVKILTNQKHTAESHVNNTPNKKIDTLIEKVASNKELKQSIEKIFDKIKSTVESVQNVLSKATKLFTQATQKFEDKKELVMKNLNLNFLGKILKEHLDEQEIQTITNFVETGTPERFCKAFANNPKSFLSILQELLKTYSSKIESIEIDHFVPAPNAALAG